MGILLELRHVVRRLRRAPMFTVVTLLTIAIGVGANSAIFSVINGVLLKPLPYSNPNELVAVWQTAPRLNIPQLEASPSDYFTFREENRTFQAFGTWSDGSLSATGGAAPEQVRTVWVTEGVLNALGVQPVQGRWFTQADDQPEAPDVTIATYGYAQRKFGSDRAALGGKVVLDGKPHVIVGVMPQGFRLLDEKPELILPQRFNRAKTNLGNFSYRALARLRPGVTLQQANADVARMIPMVNQRFPPPPGFSAKLFEEAGIAAALKPLKEDLVGGLRKTLWVLMGSIGVVLLIACANVANLLLVRAEGRQQELAIRFALGAGARRIATELLTESLLLSVLGGLGGLGLAYAALRVLTAHAPAYLPRVDSIGLDPVVLAFTLAIALFAGLLFGIFPVWKYASPNAQGTLRAGGRSLSASRERHRARNTLVVLQTALALILLIGSGLMVRTFRALRRVDPGFSSPTTLQTLRIYIPDTLVKDEQQVIRVQQEIRRKLAEIPGVASAAFANSVPTDGYNSTDILYAEDRHYAEGQLPPLRRFKFVGPGFFETMGTRLIAGRDLNWHDLEPHGSAVLVSENFAREMWQSPSAALGKRIREGMKDQWREIVGVVGDVRLDGADQKPPKTIYWPLYMEQFWGNEKFVQRRSVFVLRTPRAGSASLLAQARQAVWSVLPEVPVVSERTMEAVFRETMSRSSFTLVMLAIAGGMALLLGMVGIYGVISYSVSQRTRELGIRLALGARNGEVRGMVVRHGVLLAGLGIVAGAIGAAAVTRVMASLLFETSPVDPMTYVLASAGLLAAAAAASYVPAWRASSIDPNQALRIE